MGYRDPRSCSILQNVCTQVKSEGNLGSTFFFRSVQINIWPAGVWEREWNDLCDRLRSCQNYIK